jgi:hypothetical protein
LAFAGSLPSNSKQCQFGEPRNNEGYIRQVDFAGLKESTQPDNINYDLGEFGYCRALKNIKRHGDYRYRPFEKNLTFEPATHLGSVATPQVAQHICLPVRCTAYCLILISALALLNPKCAFLPQKIFCKKPLLLKHFDYMH